MKLLKNTSEKIKWCTGCGNYSILKQVKQALVEINVNTEKIVFVSGIGCSSRFPYYINTYGLHGIHGRAPAIATGIKIANTNLSVWIITGDGDGLSIGITHLIHLIKKNININILLFNNEIFGLTKGQSSPTSQLNFKNLHKIHNLTPPINPLSIALASNATFISRSIDTNITHLKKCIIRSYLHKGTSLLEIYQTCNVFNNNAFKKYQNNNNCIYLEHGKKLIFGINKNKGITIKNLSPKIIKLPTKDKLWVHDENNLPKASILLNLLNNNTTSYPKPFGVFYKKNAPCYETLFYQKLNRNKYN
jgi:2-oxoglutarate ferredoxin oxidoreductase subunit beta